MSSKNNFQKELKGNITLKLDNALADLKSLLSEEEFADRIKKAAKLLAAGVKSNVASKDAENVEKKRTDKDVPADTKEILNPIVEDKDAKKPSKKIATKKAASKRK